MLGQRVRVGIGVTNKMGCFYLRILELLIQAPYLYTFHDNVLLPIQFIGDGGHPSHTTN